MITVLGGGVGAAKFLKGLSNIVKMMAQQHLPSQKDFLNVIVNTGDDIDIYGFRISPDIDTIIYRLSNSIDEKKGWGLSDDTFNFLQSLSKLGHETWFQVGDKDLATHFYKKSLKEKGLTLSEITKEVANKFGIKNINILPMTNEQVETWIDTNVGLIHFQEYYIKQRMEPEVKDIRIKGKEIAKPAPGVISAIKKAEVIIICPSNPIISIGPILEIKGIKEELIKSKAKKIAVSPLIGKKPLKGPADRLMKGLNLEVSSTQIAKLYKDFLQIMVIDDKDANESAEIESLGIKTIVTDTIMSDDKKSEALARKILNSIGIEL